VAEADATREAQQSTPDAWQAGLRAAMTFSTVTDAAEQR
jgi:hypothetical protein